MTFLKLTVGRKFPTMLNGPFARLELETLVSDLKFIRDPQNNYPTRGTFE